MSPEVAKFIAPKKTYFGSGATSRIGEAIKWFKAKRIFVVTDRGVRKAGLASILLREIEATRSTAEVFDETRPEPTVDTVEAAAKELTRMGGADLIVSLGGGSVIDVAKCANVVASNGGSILDYEDGIEHPRRVGRVLPSAAIPTTAGTGSEATVWAVFIDPSRKYKTAIQDERLVADLAILDTEMTKTMPAAVTAATGMDALTHAIESYVSRYANPLTDALCVQAIALVAQSLGKAVRNGKDTAARANMLLASYMAGSAFNNSSLGIVHTMAEALGGFYGIPHGVTNALMLPHVMRFNAGATPARYADVAKLMGEDVSGMNRREAAERAATSVEELRRRTGLPDRLRVVGVKKKDFPALLDIADRWANLSGNPRNVTRRQLESLYEKAY
jgi:alcohol dehydrogenase